MIVILDMVQSSLFQVYQLKLSDTELAWPPDFGFSVFKSGKALHATDMALPPAFGAPSAGIRVPGNMDQFEFGKYARTERCFGI